MNKIAIAIDGPSAAGKSTIAKEIAEKLDYIYVDTGALYRAIALNVILNGGDTENEEQVLSVLEKTKISIKYENKLQRVILNGKDVSEEIREPRMSMAASNVSKLAGVRSFLMDLQRDMAKNYNVVMDGRDIGTVILPQAAVKIFLTAAPEERAKRRFLEYKEKGISVQLDELIAQTKQRDYNDSHREVSPLKPCEGAHVVDSTHLNFKETTDHILSIIGDELK
ncbi:MAG: (d)CMP kinase [Oscillospiraceae bacterium]